MSTTALGESADVPIESNTDSKPNETITIPTSVVSPMDVVVSPMDVVVSPADGVYAKESGADVEENSPTVKRKVEQLQAPAAKKPRVSSDLDEPCTLHSGIVADRPDVDMNMLPDPGIVLQNELLTDDDWGIRDIGPVTWDDIVDVGVGSEKTLLIPKAEDQKKTLSSHSQKRVSHGRKRRNNAKKRKRDFKKNMVKNI
jgi:hypothetical protein